MDHEIIIIALDFVNAYVLPAQAGFILIDTGLPSQWAALEKALTATGSLPDKLKLVILTHGDWDHAGNAARLRTQYGVKIAMHAGDVPQVADGVWQKRRVRPLAYRLFFSLRMLKMKLQKSKPRIDQFKPDILLTDGQSLAEYGADATVMHLPGHTPGSLGILTADGNFFAGDTFINRKKPVPAQIVANDSDLSVSLGKLRQLPIKTVYPGHGLPFQWSALTRTR